MLMPSYLLQQPSGGQEPSLERIIYNPKKTVCENALVKLNNGKIPFDTRMELTKILCVLR